MLWIVLPVASLLVEVRLVEIVLVVIVYVIVVDIDVDVAVAPSAIPTPVPAPGSSERDACPECNRRSCGIISWGRIINRGIGVDGRTINHYWVV